MNSELNMDIARSSWSIEDEFEVMRLKKLLCDNILRVEKENLDIVRGILSESNSSAKKATSYKTSKPNLQTRVLNHVKAEKEKSILLKELNRNNNGRNIASNKNSNSLSMNSTCKSQPAKSKNKKSHVKGKDFHGAHSDIKFLNDFSSSLLSAKMTNRFLPSDSKSKYAPCAVPLAPPEQKMPLSRTNNCSQNVAFHHVKFKHTGTEHLSLQTLPSITIEGKKRCHHENFSVHEVNRESTFKSGICADPSRVKTTFFPIQAQEKTYKLSKHPSLIENDKSHLSDSGTQTDSHQSAVPESVLHEQTIKLLFKETLENFEKRSSEREKKSEINVHEEEKGNCDSSKIHPSETVPLPLHSLYRNSISHANNSLTSNSTQTNLNNGIDNPFILYQNELRAIIQDVVMDNIEYLQNYIKSDSCVNCNASAITSEGIVSDRNANCTKSVQVSLTEEETFHPAVEKNTKYTADAPVLEKEKNPLEISSNTESMLKSIYEHICGEKMNTSTSEIVLERRCILTRDVAVQFNPLQTCSKGTITNEMKTIDAFSQCETTSDIVTKSMKNTYVQSSADLMQSAVSLKFTDSCTQFEEQEIVLLDASTQISVPSTPLSESLLMSDMLSEGEVVLPCDLRLLYLHGKISTDVSFSDEIENRNDKGNNSLSDGEVRSRLFPGQPDFNTSLTDETSDISGKENDYSLSEGEIHPDYVKLLEHNESHILDTYKEGKKHLSFPSEQIRLHMRHPIHPSISETELSSGNTSLSQGEVPSNDVNYNEKCVSPPIIKSPVDNQLSTILHYAKSYMQMDDHKFNFDSSDAKIIKPSEIIENEQYRMGPASIPSTSRAILQTVEEETSSHTSL